MTDATTGIQGLTAAVITAAALIGAIRLWLWSRAGGPAAAAWRTPVLISLQTAAAVLLYLTLHPPATGASGTVLRVITDAQDAPASSPGEIVVALPEAPSSVEAVRAPDLATALRRYPRTRTVRVTGDGLPPRDQEPLSVPLEYEPGPPPAGVIEQTPPAPVAPGSTFHTSGRIGALRSGFVELVDPADQVVDRAQVAAGDRFSLIGHARAPGLALFHLRLRDDQERLIEDIFVPVETRDPAAVRIMLLAGAPGPEVRQIRRWAEGIDLDVTLQVDLGAGVRLGAAALTPATLAQVDLLIVDDRRWAALPPASRAAVAAAVRQGMGLLLRPTGPLDAATRRQWAALGVPLSGTGDAVAPPQGSGALTRFDLDHEGDGVVAILRDDDGHVTAGWSALGAGRVGYLTLADTYVLALTGQPQRHARIWAAAASALARAGDDSRPRAQGPSWIGRRMSVCGLQDEGRVIDPEGGERRLIIDPRAGSDACAAYWPQLEGWHVAVDARDRPGAFHVQPAQAAPSLIREKNRRATQEMAAASRDADRTAGHRAPGSPWPWFAGLLAVLAGLWRLERRRPRPPD